jgi:hypothetical protein
MDTRKVRLENGRLISVPADATPEQIDLMVEEAEAAIYAEERAARPPRPMDQRVGSADEREQFDRIRPGLVDDFVGESVGRSFDAGVMGMGEQIRSFQRGISNLNPWQTDEEGIELDRQAAAAEQFAEDSYGTSNPFATGVGEFGAAAPTLAAPGRIPAQMLWAGIEAGIDHSSNDNALADAGVAATTAGIFGKAFDLVGRVFSNGGGAAIDAVTGRAAPRVSGQSAEETQRLLQVAEREGMNLTPAQRSRQRRQAQDEARMSSQPSGQKLHDIWEEQRAHLNKMVADRFGIDNVDNFTPEVRRQIDEVITKAYKDAEKGLTRTVGDDRFLTNVAELAVDAGLTKAQKKQLDDYAMRVAEGMDGDKLVNLRKKLVKQRSNNQGTNGDYSDALDGLINEIDDLIERTAPTGVAARFADARDMARDRMALEKGAAIGNDGNLNGRSLNTALGNIFQGEYKRGRGHSRPETQRVFDAASLSNFLSDGIPNSGTATREYRGITDRIIDKHWGEPAVDFYLNNPRLYGLFDPMGDLGRAAAARGGREAAIDAENIKEDILDIK